MNSTSQPPDSQPGPESDPQSRQTSGQVSQTTHQATDRAPGQEQGQAQDAHPDSELPRNSAEVTTRPGHDTGSRMGQLMIIGFWILALGLGYLWASRHLDFMNNPNSDPQTITRQGQSRVELAINRYGHYVANGTINGREVTFLLDTGASSVSIPEALARRLKLKPGRPVRLSTANGIVTGYSVTLDSVAIGGLSRVNVRAHINPGLPDNEVLLGMSYLRHFQLKQTRGALTLEEYQ